jgi:hypothetical protein
VKNKTTHNKQRKLHLRADLSSKPLEAGRQYTDLFRVLRDKRKENKLTS